MFAYVSISFAIIKCNRFLKGMQKLVKNQFCWIAPFRPNANCKFQWQIEWKAWNVCDEHKLQFQCILHARHCVKFKFLIRNICYLVRNLDTIKLSNFTAHRCFASACFPSAFEHDTLFMLHSLMMIKIPFYIRMILHMFKCIYARSLLLSLRRKIERKTKINGLFDRNGHSGDGIANCKHMQQLKQNQNINASWHVCACMPTPQCIYCSWYLALSDCI